MPKHKWTLMYRDGTFDQDFCESWVYVAVLETGIKLPVFSSKEEAEITAERHYNARRVPDWERPEPRAIQFCLPAKLIRRSSKGTTTELFDWKKIRARELNG